MNIVLCCGTDLSHFERRYLCPTDLATVSSTAVKQRSVNAVLNQLVLVWLGQHSPYKYKMIQHCIYIAFAGYRCITLCDRINRLEATILHATVWAKSSVSRLRTWRRARVWKLHALATSLTWINGKLILQQATIFCTKYKEIIYCSTSHHQPEQGELTNHLCWI